MLLRRRVDFAVVAAPAGMDTVVAMLELARAAVRKPDARVKWLSN
jgi:hypothetical protein